MEIVIGTGNEGKKKEMLMFFSRLTSINFLSLNDFSPLEEPEENGKDFESNALIKAVYYAENLEKTRSSRRFWIDTRSVSRNVWPQHQKTVFGKRRHGLADPIFRTDA